MRPLLFLVLWIFSLTVFSQTLLENPSFEDTPSDAMVPHGWLMCNDSTTPDILPGFWGVYDRAKDGRTYVGLITRPDGSYETIGQRLNPVLQEKECYQMSLNLAHSHSYAAYNEVIKIRIYLSSSKCDKEQLIYTSPPIEHRAWKTYQFDFVPKSEMKYIRIEAHSLSRKRGNILIDNVSAINVCSRA